MERSHPGDAWTVLRRVAITSCVAILFTSLVASGASSFSDERQAATADVVVDVGSERQVIQGFGSSERVWNDPHVSDNPTTVVPESAQVSILRSLYGRLGLTRVRPVLDQGTQKRRGGSFEFQGKLGDAHIAYVKQARRFGLTTFFPGPVYLEPWIGEQDAAAYADWAMAMLRRWRAAGVEPAFYAPQNEPQVNENFSPDFLRRAVIELGRRLRAAGFKTKLVVPDDENPIDAYRRASAILADPQARKYVGAVAYHIYRIGDTHDIERMGQLAARYGLPVWMTEYTNPQYDAWPAALDWAVKMHTLMVNGRASAVDYLWGFFGSWQRPATLVSLDFDAGVYKGMSLTPVYWLTGQWSRYVRPGYRRVTATPAASGILTSAFSGAGKVVVVSVNPETVDTTVRYTLRGKQVSSKVAVVRTSAGERWRALPATRTKASRFTLRLPPRSVTTFVLTTPR